jgi:hypothetical protein
MTIVMMKITDFIIAFTVFSSLTVDYFVKLSNLFPFCSDVSVVPVSTNGCVVPQDVLSEVRSTTCLVTVMLANNETGVIMPVEEIGR